jgi:hypothetical protein
MTGVTGGAETAYDSIGHTMKWIMS